MKIRAGHVIRAIIVLVVVAIVLPLSFFLFYFATTGGTGSPEEAARLRAVIEPIADPESGYGCDPEYASYRFPNGEWALGIGRDSHAILSKFRGGGTVVVKDSTGQIRCFFGHVCGSGSHEAYMRGAESLDAFYKNLKDAGRTEYRIP